MTLHWFHFITETIQANKKAFQLNAKRQFSDSLWLLVNKFAHVFWGWDGRRGVKEDCAVRSKLNKFEHVPGGVCVGWGREEAAWVLYREGGLWSCSGSPSPFPLWTEWQDRHDWKLNLPATSLAGGNS